METVELSIGIQTENTHIIHTFSRGDLVSMFLLVYDGHNPKWILKE